MTKTTRAASRTPVDEQLDPEVVQFRANFEGRSTLDELIREGAQRMLQTAINEEVDDFLARHADRTDEQGRRLVVRNGQLPSREIMSGAGSLEVRQPRVCDNSPDKESRVTFAPSVLPPVWLCVQMLHPLRRGPMEGGRRRSHIPLPPETSRERCYGNIEGVDWLSPSRIVTVSDRRKSKQPAEYLKRINRFTWSS